MPILHQRQHICLERNFPHFPLVSQIIFFSRSLIKNHINSAKFLLHLQDEFFFKLFSRWLYNFSFVSTFARIFLSPKVNHFHHLQHKMQDVNYDDKAQKHAQSDKVYHIFHLSIDWFASYPLNDRK